MKTIIYLLIFFVSLPLFFSCDKEDKLQFATPYTETTTSEYLRANRFKMFDMALDLYEKAGYLDLLDKKDVTVFMPSDYSIRLYMKQKQLILRVETENPTAEYTYENLLRDLPTFKDSLQMYIVDTKINRSDLDGIGDESILVKSLLGTDMQIYLQQTKLYTEHVPNAVNKYLYYKYIINGLDDPDMNIDDIPVEERDVTNYCQTSGLITTTGILHVMRDDHPLFFNKMKLP